MVFRRFDFDDGKIGLAVAANHLGVMHNARRIILEHYPNAVSTVHHVEVGHNVAVGVHDHARTQGALAPSARTLWTFTIIWPLPAKEAVKEILEGILPIVIRVIRIIRVIWIIRIIAVVGTTHTAAWRLGRAFRVDIHDCGLKLLGYLPKGIAELLR